MLIKSQKDFFSGLMFTVTGAAFAYGATGYSIGTGGRMGPGYFPLLLGIILSLLFWKSDARYKPGYLAGQFVLWMGAFRVVAETVREPDIGVYGLFGMTMGQTLCVPMILLGLYLIFSANGRRQRMETRAGHSPSA